MWNVLRWLWPALRATSSWIQLRGPALVLVFLSLLFIAQLILLAIILMSKMRSGVCQKPSVSLEIQTDLLFLVSTWVSLCASWVNHEVFRLGHLEFRAKLPLAVLIRCVLTVVFSVKTQVLESQELTASVLPAIDLIQSGIWLWCLQGGVYEWLIRNARDRKLTLLCGWVRYLMISLALALLLILVVQIVLFLRGRGLTSCACFASDALYWVAMASGFVSYWEMRGKAIFRSLRTGTPLLRTF